MRRGEKLNNLISKKQIYGIKNIFEKSMYIIEFLCSIIMAYSIFNIIYVNQYTEIKPYLYGFLFYITTVIVLGIIIYNFK